MITFHQYLESKSLKLPTADKILFKIRSHPGITRGDLLTGCSISRKLVWDLLAKYVDLGIVRAVEDGNGVVRYYPVS